ncbi:MAG TPA: SDR family NAD(P)-dependent oxidoreductase [Anaerolineales bacterium]|nr:SDR family NAD(P)-dependent oxidoreductase [Anaerolineales bacterium]
MKKYFKEYKWSNIFAMLRNQQLVPEICTEDFTDRLVVITGATSGIGYVTAKKYASHGAEILCINRNETKSKELCETLKDQYDAKCTYLIADFTKLEDVHNVGKRLAAMNKRIDVLIHNAGVYVTTKTLTANNLETVFQANYLCTFILNNYLKEKFIEQKGGRILFVNSEAHRFAMWGMDLNDLNWEKHLYTGLKSYSAAKLAQLLSVIKFNEYFSGTGVTVNAMHPGNVTTNSGQNNGPIYKFFKKLLVDKTAKPLENSAEALYFLGVSSKLNNTSGKFFNLTTEEEPAPPALDKDAAEELWKISLELAEKSKQD